MNKINADLSTAEITDKEAADKSAAGVDQEATVLREEACDDEDH